MSVYVRLRDALAAAVTGLGLSVGGDVLTVSARKLPVRRDSLDALPACLVVIGDGPESTQPFTTGNEQLVGYLVQVVLVADTQRQPKQNEATLLDARESVRKLLQRPGAVGTAVAELLRVEVTPGAPLGRASWLRQFDVTSLSVRYFCVEAAT